MVAPEVVSEVVDTGALAHTVHYALVVAGLVGLAAILLPHAVQRRSRPTGRAALGAHEVRVEDLRRRASAGTLATVPTLATPSVTTRAPESGTDPLRTLWLPLALVGSTAAAAVHAAVGPPHLGPLPLVGAFLVGCALAQAGWSALLLLAPSRRLLLAGVAGHGALLVLWLTSRQVGLPGVLPQPEPVGAWDLLAALWETLAVVSCLVLLRRTADAPGGVARPVPGVAHWLDWRPRAHLVVALSATALLVTAVSGAPA